MYKAGFFQQKNKTKTLDLISSEYVFEESLDLCKLIENTPIKFEASVSFSEISSLFLLLQFLSQNSLQRSRWKNE